MKKTLVFSILILFIGKASAQSTYDLFSIEGLNYGIIYVDSFDKNKVSNHSTFFEGDTTINGKKLLKYANYTNSLRKHYLYIDERKVYYHDYVNDFSYIIYDFSLEVNDTFTDYKGHKYIVKEKESKNFPDGRKRISLLLKYDNIHDFRWIEGIGEIELGPFSNAYIHRYDLKFICASDNNGIIYSSDDNKLDCDSLFCKRAIPKFDFEKNNQTISFINQSINAKKIFWDFGNGVYSEVLNPIQTFGQASCIPVTLAAISECGDTSFITKKVKYCIDGDWEVEKTINVDKKVSNIFITDPSTILISTNDKLRKSKDSGSTFDQLNYTNEEKSKIVDFHALDSKVIVLSSISGGLTKSFSIDISKDNGSTWVRSREFIAKWARLKTKYNSGILILELLEKNEITYELSLDYGQNWTQIVNPNKPNSVKLTFDKDSTLMAFYNQVDNQIMSQIAEISRDNGLSWMQKQSIEYKKKFVLDKNNIFLITQSNELILTNDFFQTYKQIYQFQSDLNTELFFTDIQKGFIGNNAYTVDGGKSWLPSNCEEMDVSLQGLDYKNDIFGYDGQTKIFRFTPPNFDQDCKVSSVETNNKPSIDIYPNPINQGGSFKIDYKNELDIEIVNALGESVFKTTTIENQIQTSHLSKGYYFVFIKDKLQKYKWIKCLIIL